jgi:hypothetical protein
VEWFLLVWWNPSMYSKIGVFANEPRVLPAHPHRNPLQL